MQPSPLIASVDANQAFDPARHVAFGGVFVDKSMSALPLAYQALVEGVGMPDRAGEGWVRAEGGAALPDELLAGFDAHSYPDGAGAWVSVGRVRVGAFIAAANELGLDAVLTDHTPGVARVGLMGPDAPALLAAIDTPAPESLAVGELAAADVIEVPVQVARSDFAGPLGFDLVIPAGPFNMVLAVLCSWAVRLELRLLPVGLDAVGLTRTECGRLGDTQASGRGILCVEGEREENWDRAAGSMLHAPGDRGRAAGTLVQAVLSPRFGPIGLVKPARLDAVKPGQTLVLTHRYRDIGCRIRSGPWVGADAG